MVLALVACDPFSSVYDSTVTITGIEEDWHVEVFTLVAEDEEDIHKVDDFGEDDVEGDLLEYVFTELSGEATIELNIEDQKIKDGNYSSPGEKIAKSNEPNISFELDFGSEANFVIRDLEVEPEEAVPGQEGEISFKVENIGFVEEKQEITASFSEDGESYGSPFASTDISIEPGYKETISFIDQLPANIQPGGYYFKIESEDDEGVISFDVVAGTVVYPGQEGQFHGDPSQGSLFVVDYGKDTTDIDYIYFAYDIDDYEEDRALDSAELRLYLDNCDGTDGQIAAFDVIEEWMPGWLDPEDPPEYDKDSLADPQSMPSSPEGWESWFSWEVTDIVAGWEGQADTSLMLKPIDELEHEENEMLMAIFNSSDAEKSHPHLVVKYSD